MEHYDILLFENQENSANHKYDMCLIGRMLQNNGLKVAVVDIYGQDSGLDQLDGIKVIHPIKNAYVPEKNCIKKKHFGRINNLIYNYLLSRYYLRVMESLIPMADMFYCGSYNDNLPQSLLKQKKPCFFWGLRSSRVGRFKDLINQDWYLGLKYYYLKRLFFKNKFNYFLYSNEIIKEEFLDLGFPKYRLIHREERCVESDSDFVESESSSFAILSIGQLRPQKHIERIVQAFKTIDEKNAIYYIIGRSNGDYESVIRPYVAGSNNIVRVNEVLDYVSFNSYFSKTQFLVLADEKAPSSVTNGTMMEALIHKRPIIAPNYNPYAYYVNKYGVGLLYEYDDQESLAKTLIKASQIGYKSFRKNIENFLETISFDKVSKEFSDSIRNIQYMVKE